MDHYTTLNLASPGNLQGENVRTPTTDNIKQAYRIALLTHHPDKTNVVSVSKMSSAGKPSIDAIKLAYKILADPITRAEYDRELIVRQNTAVDNRGSDNGADACRGFRTGEELIDLDDMAYDETAGLWYRACRCGEIRGYTVTEAQLEDEERKGGREVVVGCGGCSLWLRIAFDVMDEHGNHGE
jgi:diphthamide biosynthesis protein 4